MALGAKTFNFGKFLSFYSNNMEGNPNPTDVAHNWWTSMDDHEKYWYFYDDTYDNNEDELVNSDKSGIIDVLDIIKEAMAKKRAKNITVTIADDEYISDVINVWMKLDNNPTYVLSLCKGIYEEKINEWLELN